MRGGHQAADLRDIAGGEEFYGPEHALVLPDHMGGTAPLRVGQCRGGQLSGCRITQEWDAERGRGGMTLLAPLVVLSTDERVRDAALDQQQGDIPRECDRPDLGGPAVEENGVIALAEEAGDLVEEAALDADESVLGTAAELCQFNPWKGDGEEF